jgi:ATP-dependent Clp protease ATP-binding subunit ClpA
MYLKFLIIKKQIVRFSIEDIHREEFNNTLLKDEFIEALIIQIKTIARELKIDDIHHLLSLIDDENSNKSSEMTRFTAFLFAQLNSSLDNEYEDEEISERSKSNSSQESVKNNIQTNTNSQVNSNSKYYTTNNTSLDLCDNSCFPSNKVSHEIGIDELVEFIQKPEIKKIKKNRKKKKNKKVEPEIEINDTFIVEDEEVENFKKLMNEDGRHVNSVKKIKPTISKAWLGYVSNKVYD